MSDSDNSDIAADLKALDDALLLAEVSKGKADSSWHDLHDDSSSSSIDESDNESYSDDEFYNQSSEDTQVTNAYEINRKLTKGLMLVKKKVSILLQRCEEKIEELNEEIETSRDGTLNERGKYITAGTPYFKDKLGFSAPNNIETRLKEARGELSVLHVQKSCRWSSKNRTALLNAICDEVFNSMSISGLNVEGEQLYDRRIGNQTRDETTYGEPSSSTANSSTKRTAMVPINFSEMIRMMGDKQIDWMKIAAQNFEKRHSPGECRSMWNVYLHPDINKGDWTTKEDNKLIQHAKQNGYQDWDTIAAQLGTKRSAYQCFIRYNTIESLPAAGRIWTKLEDEHLQLVISKLQIGNYIPWAEVATYMGSRTKQQVYTRWIYRTAPHLTKGRFNDIETQTLLDAVKRYGTDFSKISRHVMPHRTTVQLSGHYQSILQTKANVWTYEDDIKLLKLHKKYGNVWVKIAKNFAPKTRTQVRHRCKALQRYINRGYKITTIPRSVNQTMSLDNKKINKSSSSSSSSSSPSSSVQKSKSINRKAHLLSNISNNTIQARLFENLNFPLVTGNTSSEEVYDDKQLARNTKELYDTLKLLDANFDVPDMLFDYAHLSKKERQLFTSLKRYVNAHHCVDNEKRDKIIERYRHQMFGSATNVTSHFIPPLPFNGYVKRKRQYKTDSINYDSNCNEKFLVDVTRDRIIPSNVNSVFVDVEEDIQFQKLSQLLINDNYNCNRQNVNSHTSLGHNSSLKEIRTRAPLRFKSNRTTTVERATETVQSCKTQETTPAECTNKDDEQIDMLKDAITPSHETLLGLKNLMYWKMLYDYETNKSYSISKISTQQRTKVSRSPEYEKAYQTLKTRLIRLFKLPLALSRIMLELPEQESLFEEQRERSTKKWSEKQAQENR